MGPCRMRLLDRSGQSFDNDICLPLPDPRLSILWPRLSKLAHQWGLPSGEWRG